jgi:hypothetical protein
MDDIDLAGYKGVRIEMRFWQVADGWTGEWILIKPDGTRQVFTPATAGFQTREVAKQRALEDARRYIDHNY